MKAAQRPELRHGINGQRGARPAALGAKLAAAVLGLAVGRSGVWFAEQPDGSRLVNRHVIDFAYVTEFMLDDLPQQTREDMAEFVTRELLQPQQGWMRAQSLLDPAAARSDRTD